MPPTPAGEQESKTYVHVIRDKSPEFSDARNLAALGWSVALDMENFAADTLERLQKGGIRQ